MGIAALAVVSLNIFTSMANADLRAEVNERRQFINQSIKLRQLHKQLIQGLANLSARSGDEQLRQVLARHGINFTVKAPAPAQIPVSASPQPVEPPAAVQPTTTSNPAGDRE